MQHIFSVMAHRDKSVSMSAWTVSNDLMGESFGGEAWNYTSHQPMGAHHPWCSVGAAASTEGEPSDRVYEVAVAFFAATAIFSKSLCFFLTCFFFKDYSKLSYQGLRSHPW